MRAPLEDIYEKGVVLGRGCLWRSARAPTSPDFERADVTRPSKFVGEHEGVESAD